MVSIKQFIEIVAVIIYVNIFYLLPFFIILLSSFMLFKLTYTQLGIFLLYLIYIYFDNHKRILHPNKSGCKFLRHNKLCSHVRNYFPVEIVKTKELSADRNYLFLNAPHGVCCVGLVNNMANNIREFTKLYPGIRPKIATLNMFFWLPLVREWIYSLGIVPCSKDSLTNILNYPINKEKSGNYTSNAVVIVIGGVKETLDTKPGVHSIYILKRKGFIKLAIETGCPIVPTYTFGEQDLFPQVLIPHKIKKFELISLFWLAFSTLLVHLPKKQRLVQVVGAPIEVEKLSAPTTEYVDKIHRKVLDGFQEIFNTYKHKYLENASDAELIFV